MKTLTIEQMEAIEGGSCRNAVWRAGLAIGLKTAGLIATAVISGGAFLPVITAIIISDATMALTLWGLVDACSS